MRNLRMWAAWAWMALALLPSAAAQAPKPAAKRLGAIPVCNRVRFVPRQGNADRMVGGKFQGSNVGPTSDFVDLAAVTSAPPEGRYSELTFPNARPYRFLRYYAPAGSYGNVAEIEFYHGTEKISGNPFGTYGSLNNSGSSYLKAFDGDPNTFFDGPLADDQYAGIEIAGPESASAAGAFVPGGRGRRHYHIGNSLTDTEGEYTQAIAQSAGFLNDFFDRSTIPGSPLKYNWEATSSFGSPYREGFVKDAPLDDLILQAFIQNGDSQDPAYSLKFYDLARQNSPPVRPWIYGQWAGLGEENPATARAPYWEAQTLAYMPVYLAHALKFQQARPGVKVGVIPGGLALVRLKHAVEAGRVPGMTGFFSSLFADGIHLTGAGRYFIGLVHYACLYGRSPVGLPVVSTNGFAPALTLAQACVFQQIAWDTVKQFEKNPGMVAPLVPSEIDARAYVDGIPPFMSSADVRYINKDSSYDYIVNALKAGSYQLRVSAGNGSGSAKPLDVLLGGVLVQTISISATPNETTFTDAPSVTLAFKAGANLVTLHVPVDRPYNLNSLKFTSAAVPHLAETLPTTDLFAYQPEVKAGEPYTVSFNVREAGRAAEALTVAATADNLHLFPAGSLVVTAGDFADRYGNHFNRRLIAMPAPGQTGKAIISLTIKGSGGIIRSLGTALTVK